MTLLLPHSTELEPSTGTMASAVYQSLRRDIVRCVLMPGAKLRIDVVRERYGNVGASPVREALNRLSAEGLVVYQDQRGFQVAPVSRSELEELTRTRCLINETLLRESIARGDAAWEDHVVLSHHRLSRTAEFLVDETVNPEYERRHQVFHASLVAACGSRWLLEFSDKLFELSQRFRNLSVRGALSEQRDVATEHAQIMQAVLDRDVTAATRLSNEHVRRTAEFVLGRSALWQAPPAETMAP
jgi:GntR family carbon starvation induced transcriptional regulator